MRYDYTLVERVTYHQETGDVTVRVDQWEVLDRRRSSLICVCNTAEEADRVTEAMNFRWGW